MGACYSAKTIQSTAFLPTEVMATKQRNIPKASELSKEEQRKDQRKKGVMNFRRFGFGRSSMPILKHRLPDTNCNDTYVSAIDNAPVTTCEEITGSKALITNENANLIIPTKTVALPKPTTKPTTLNCRLPHSKRENEKNIELSKNITNSINKNVNDEIVAPPRKTRIPGTSLLRPYKSFDTNNMNRQRTSSFNVLKNGASQNKSPNQEQGKERTPSTSRGKFDSANKTETTTTQKRSSRSPAPSPRGSATDLAAKARPSARKNSTSKADCQSRNNSRSKSDSRESSSQLHAKTKNGSKESLSQSRDRAKSSSGNDSNSLPPKSLRGGKKVSMQNHVGQSTDSLPTDDVMAASTTSIDSGMISSIGPEQMIQDLPSHTNQMTSSVGELSRAEKAQLPVTGITSSYHSGLRTANVAAAGKTSIPLPRTHIQIKPNEDEHLKEKMQSTSYMAFIMKAREGKMSYPEAVEQLTKHRMKNMELNKGPVLTDSCESSSNASSVDTVVTVRENKEKRWSKTSDLGSSIMTECSTTDDQKRSSMTSSIESMQISTDSVTDGGRRALNNGFNTGLPWDCMGASSDSITEGILEEPMPIDLVSSTTSNTLETISEATNSDELCMSPDSMKVSVLSMDNDVTDCRGFTPDSLGSVNACVIPYKAVEKRCLPETCDFMDSHDDIEECEEKNGESPSKVSPSTNFMFVESDKELKKSILFMGTDGELVKSHIEEFVPMKHTDLDQDVESMAEVIDLFKTVKTVSVEEDPKETADHEVTDEATIDHIMRTSDIVVGTDSQDSSRIDEFSATSSSAARAQHSSPRKHSFRSRIRTESMGSTVSCASSLASDDLMIDHELSDDEEPPRCGRYADVSARETRSIDKTESIDHERTLLEPLDGDGPFLEEIVTIIENSAPKGESYRQQLGKQAEIKRDLQGRFETGVKSQANIINEDFQKSCANEVSSQNGIVPSSPSKMQPFAEDGESELPGVTIDEATYQYLMQDTCGITSLLQKLKTTLQEADTVSPFEASYTSLQKSLSSSCTTDGSINQDLCQENQDLKRQLVFLQQQIEEKNRTIQRLEGQMETFRNRPRCGSTGSDETDEKDVRNAATQTDRIRSLGINGECRVDEPPTIRRPENEDYLVMYRRPRDYSPNFTQKVTYFTPMTTRTYQRQPSSTISPQLPRRSASATNAVDSDHKCHLSSTSSRFPLPHRSASASDESSHSTLSVNSCDLSSKVNDLSLSHKL